MNVNKFGHHVHKIQSGNTPTLESIFDGQQKIIKRIGTPIDPNDCANKEYIDKLVEQLSKKIKSVNELAVQLSNDITSINKKIDCLGDKIKRK